MMMMMMMMVLFLLLLVFLITTQQIIVITSRVRCVRPYLSIRLFIVSYGIFFLSLRVVPILFLFVVVPLLLPILLPATPTLDRELCEDPIQLVKRGLIHGAMATNAHVEK